MGRSLGQVSLVQVTASSRWTTTVPKQSRNGIARIGPPLLMRHLKRRMSAPNRGVTGSTDQNNEVLRTAFQVSSNAHARAAHEQQPNTLTYFLAASVLEGHAPGEVEHVTRPELTVIAVRRLMQVVRVGHTEATHTEWAVRRSCEPE
jgi:hypothetical protein